MRSVTTKLKALSQDFNFELNQQTIDDHEKLAALLYYFDLGNHPSAIKLSIEHYINYIQYGRDYLNQRFIKPTLFQQDPIIIPASDGINIIDDSLATQIIEQHHYLGYDREGFHLGYGINGKLVAVATISPCETETVNISRAIKIPGQECILSQLYAKISDWLKKFTKYKELITHCNPNMGHYGIVYRGVNMKPVGTDNTNLMSFLHGRYISKRQAMQLNDPSIITKKTPLPQLIYGLKIR